MLVIVLFALSLSLTFLTLVALAQVPVILFVYARPLLPDGFCLIVLCGCGIVVALFLALATGVWLQGAARGQDEIWGKISALSADMVVRPVSTSEGWNRWGSLHVSHESARAGLFAGGCVLLGFVFQCLAVLAGPAHFAGPIGVSWRWSLTFGEQLVATTLLGIPEGNVPTFGRIEPVTTIGRLLVVWVDIFYAAGVIGLGVLMFSSLFQGSRAAARYNP